MTQVKKKKKDYRNSFKAKFFTKVIPNRDLVHMFVHLLTLLQLNRELADFLCPVFTALLKLNRKLERRQRVKRKLKY